MNHKLRRAVRAYVRRATFAPLTGIYRHVVQATCYRTAGVRRGAKRRGR